MNMCVIKLLIQLKKVAPHLQAHIPLETILITLQEHVSLYQMKTSVENNLRYSTLQASPLEQIPA